MYGYLTELGLEKGVDFHEQFPYGAYLIDFAFIIQRKPFRGLAIETDGFLWHSSPEAKRRDNYRNYKLLKGGWITERFGETFTKEEVKEVLVKHGVLAPSL